MRSLDCHNFYSIRLSAIFALTTVHNFIPGQYEKYEGLFWALDFLYYNLYGFVRRLGWAQDVVSWETLQHLDVS
jgi:hypothetical protein